MQELVCAWDTQSRRIFQTSQVLVYYFLKQRCEIIHCIPKTTLHLLSTHKSRTERSVLNISGANTCTSMIWILTLHWAEHWNLWCWILWVFLLIKMIKTSQFKQNKKQKSLKRYTAAHLKKYIIYSIYSPIYSQRMKHQPNLWKALIQNCLLGVECKTVKKSYLMETFRTKFNQTLILNLHRPQLVQANMYLHPFKITVLETVKNSNTEKET